MNHTLQIGNTAIPYDITYSTRATRKRIVVTPEGVEVVAPQGTPNEGPDGLSAFLHKKRRWVFDAVREIDEKHRKLLTQQYASGAKLQYKGRWLMLDVRNAAVETVSISCRSKFHVLVPEALDGKERLEKIQDAFNVWLRDRALRDARRFGRVHEKGLGVKASAFKLSDSKERWGLCGKDGVIRIHWRLIQAPTAAMEYVVAHEVAHLIHRNHEPEFWTVLSKMIPNWKERKMMLERWETDHRAV